MAKRTVVVSDLTGELIDEAKHVSIKVLDHPTLEHPVRLDVGADEIKPLAGTASDFVVLEVLRTDAQPERMVVELAKFEKLFKVDAQEALEAAERVFDEPGPTTRRRGRPRSSAGAPAAKTDKIDYTTAENAGRLHRGRTTEQEAAWVREHREEASANRQKDGHPAIDWANSKERARYGITD